MKIASVAKALDILSEVGRHPTGATASEVAQALGMPVPTTYHLLNTLVSESALSKGADRRYLLGTRISVLSSAYFEQAEPNQQLLGPLNDLARETSETVYLSGWRGSDIEVLASAEGSHQLRVANLDRGTHEHAHARASGKLLLALASERVRELYLARHTLDALTPNTIVTPEALDDEFARIRAAGHAVDHEEYAVGISCVAVPLAFDGRVVGAYTVSAPVDRFRENEKQLRTAAFAAAERAAHPPTPAVNPEGETVTRKPRRRAKTSA
jgi:DNA-binding IclR family transcriptional regulator